MRDYKGYEVVTVSGSLSEDKLKKAVRSGKITFSAADLDGRKPLLLHPMSAKLVNKAKAHGRGVVGMLLAASDILYDMEYHGDKSVWDWMHGMTTKKAYNWVFEEAPVK